MKVKAWTFVDSIDNDDSESSSTATSSSDDFEVVPSRDFVTQGEYEVIPEQKIISLDENELEIHENYFLFGNTQPTESDSDIEVLQQCPEQHLYSQVLQKNTSNNEFLIESNENWEEEIKHWKATMESDDEDDSEIEVLSKSVATTAAVDESLEIVFSNENYFQHESKAKKNKTIEDNFDFDMLFNEEVEKEKEKEKEKRTKGKERGTEKGKKKEGKEKGKEKEKGKGKEVKEENDLGIKSLFDNQEDAEEDLGIKSLFEVKNEEQQYDIKVLFEGYKEHEDEKDVTSLFDKRQKKNQFISMKTSTLVIVFCLCVATGVCVGSGCASMFVSNGEEKDSIPSSSKQISKDLPPEIFLFLSKKINKLNITNIRSSQTMKNSVRDLLASYYTLEQEHGALKTSLEDLKERYHLQKQMTMYWKKQVKKAATDKARPIRVMMNGAIDMSKYADDVDVIIQDIVNLSPVNNDSAIADLKDQLQQEKEKVIYWQKKYTSLELSNLRKCAKIGKSMKNSTFSFSLCLSLLSNVLSDFNITSNLPLFSKPVEKISDHVNNVWSKLKSQWKIKAGNSKDQTTLENVNRFRKIFKIGNMINSVNKDEQVSEDNQYCPDAAFKSFQSRWTNEINPEFPKPEPAKLNDVCVECSVIAREGLKTLYKCGHGIYEEAIDEGFERENVRFPCLLGDIYVELVNEKSRTITKLEMPECPLDTNDNKICPDAAFKSFENRWRNAKRDHVCLKCSVIKQEGLKTLYKCGENVYEEIVEEGYERGYTRFPCELADVYVELVNGKLKTITKLGMPASDLNQQNADGNQNNDEVKDADESETWYKSKLAELSFKFDLYKWQTDRKIKDVIVEVENKMSSAVKSKNEENMTATKSNVGNGKSKDNEKLNEYEIAMSELKDKMKAEKKKFQEWKFKEKLNTKYKIEDLKMKLRKQKEEFKIKVYKAKQLVKSHLKKEYKKLTQAKEKFGEKKTKLTYRVAYYKTKYQMLTERTKNWKEKYNQLVHMYNAVLHKVNTAANQRRLKTGKKMKREKEKEKKNDEKKSWRIPMTSSRSVFNMAHFYDPKEDAPAKPIPPKRLGMPQEPKMTRQPSLDVEESITKTPDKPTPPKRLSAQQQRPSSESPAVWYGTYSMQEGKFLQRKHPKPSGPQSIYVSEHAPTPQQQTDEDGFSLPLRPSPPQGVQDAHQHNASSLEVEDDDEKAIPYSWYLYWGKQRETFNQYEEDERMNWYTARFNSRAHHYNEYNEEKVEDWYRARMNSRDSYRRQDSTEH